MTVSQIVRQVSCGAVHVVALSEDGILQAWGNASFIYFPFQVFRRKYFYFFFEDLTIAQKFEHMLEVF